MNLANLRFGLLILFACLGFVARATITVNPWTPVYRGVDYATAQADASEPVLQKVFAIRVDLSDPTVEFFSTPSNGAGSLETFGQTTTTFVQTYGVSMGVNANFFSPVNTTPNDPRDLSGLAISEGNVVSPFENGRPSVLISISNQVSFATSQPANYSNIWAAVSGSDRILINGSVQLSNCVTAFCDLNPRTAVGKSQDDRYFYLVVIDGRQPGWSDGATLAQTGEWLRRLGAWNALNLDGGGSSAMAKEQSGSAVLLNRPSGGVQRVNGNHLGFFALPLIPSIVSQPQSQTASPGINVTFSVTASGPAPLAYQWRFNATNIPGATNTSYVRSNVQLADSGLYSVIVSNSGGSVLSSNALLSVLSLQGWGDNSWGQIATPLDPASLIAVSAGAWHNLGLRTNGSIVAWGNNYDGQCEVPPTLTNAIAIAAGGYHSLAIRMDGTVAAWGGNAYGQALTPSTLANVIGVAAGTWHSLALQRDGSVRAWGDNTWGQTNLPPDLTNVIAVAAGGGHSLALKANGTVQAWGDNTDSQGTFAGQSIVPPGLSNVVAIAAGGYHSLALRSDGTVAAWGDNSQNQCAPASSVANAVSITAGTAHSVVLKTDGTLVAWGSNGAGQCSLPTTLTNAYAVGAGDSHTLVLWATTKPLPKLLAPFRNGNQFSMLAQTLNRRTYTLEFTDALTGTNWTPLPSVNGNGALKVLADPAAISPQRFYRMKTGQ